MSKHVAVAWLCLWAIRPTATILGVFILVPGHQISSRCTLCGSGASAPEQVAPLAQGGVLDGRRAGWARPDEGAN